MAIPKQMWKSKMLLLFDYYLQATNLRLIPSRNIEDQRVLQSDWTRDTTGHTQLKVVISDTAFI